MEQYLDNFHKGMKDIKNFLYLLSDDIKLAVNFMNTKPKKNEKKKNPTLAPLDGIDSASKLRNSLQPYHD